MNHTCLVFKRSHCVVDEWSNILLNTFGTNFMMEKFMIDAYTISTQEFSTRVGTIAHR